MPSIEEEKHNLIVDEEDLESEDEDDDDDDDEEDLESDDEIDEDDDEIDEELPNPSQPLKQEHQLLHQQLHQQLHQPPPVHTPTPPPPTADSAPVQKPHIEEKPLPLPLPFQQPEEKRPLPLPIDDSRRLFQRLWTDEDEIGLLQGFYEYTSQRGGFKSSAYHHDTAPFYDQIKSRLQLDFNKSQLVEKLRRLKKKYRNAMARLNSGKDLSFKTAHDQATFEVSKKIWCDIGGTGVEDEDHAIPTDFTLVNGTKALPLPHPSSASSSRKRPRTTTAPLPIPIPVTLVGQEENVVDHTNMIEETVKNCLGPLFKELMQSAVNGRTWGGLGLNPLGVSFGGNSPINFLGGVGEREMMDDKWRKQQIMELEVYSKRVELVQEQIKVSLEELRTNGNE